MIFRNKKIVLGLTGGIAIYKSASLLRRLVNDEGADVTVVMTKSAQQFMSPLIFETFSGKPVLTDMFDGIRISTRHVDLATAADAILVAPATANIVAKTANGIADDFLSTLILTGGNKTIFALAMNDNMFANPITQANIQKLRDLGYGLIEPETGDLACHTTGKGRLADESTILDYLDRRLNGSGLLAGKRVIVTAGATREFIDPVRFVSNKSTGKMGFALAKEAAKQGADVLLISGATSAPVPTEIHTIRVESAKQMEKILVENAGSADFLFMAAAVEDFCPAKISDEKIKKNDAPDQLSLSISPDLIVSFRKMNEKACVVGFSVETTDGKARSADKMNRKKMDFVVWNDPSKSGVGFESDTNEATMLGRNEKEWFFPKTTKREITAQIIQTVVENR
ncbi:MAG: bifunctional phosphopantothenoylcysteine decarboxylase/phosphopantothenate--cysteine ligase CoaBC [Candidatus Neomarinimicrobiota bacterium]